MIFNKNIQWNILVGYLLVALVVIMASCSKVKKQEHEEIILARVGDKTISLSEFERRAEQTIRPAYCRGDNNLHKKIIINSLIAEKMFSLEAGESNELTKNKRFQQYIQGRQEQAMREWLLHKQGFGQVRLENSEIQKEYDNAGKTFTVEYYNIPDDSSAAVFKKGNINNQELFEGLYYKYWQGDKIPQREVNWKSPELPLIHDALFSESVSKGSIVGPIKTGTNNYLVMKVLGWTDQVAISENERKERWDFVKEKLNVKHALRIYEDFVVSIMDGKKLQFDPHTFDEMVRLVGPLYMRSAKEKRELFLNATFNREMENPELSRLAEGINGLQNNTFFRVEDQVWTVKDFKEELQRHPLVFRKNLPKGTKFAEHFRLAIVDLIRDKYLTNEAYKRKYQEVAVVKRNKLMWQDALLADFQKMQYLKNTVPNFSDSLNALVLIKDYLNPYVEKLQQKYSKRIEINVEAFNKIKLTRIDMIVTQQNVPFPIVVPGFPLITTDSKLDYGKKME